ncbi:MAG: REDY-like protein HapK [Chloroflexota bacterium]|nr:REDY-like protein HapK [Dehalococcoidia bacterium]MDW8254386.1 REDY-like protein HapK [Chloroflexota bacterium]
MATLIVLFNLKADAAREAYERWAVERDVPTVSALTSVDSFRVLRATGLLGGGNPPYHYIEVIEVNDLARFGSEIGTEAIQEIAAEFRQFAEDPIFILTEQLALGESR